MRRRFTFLGMGLPRRAHSSSACRPRWGWGREGSQVEATARELQVPGAAEDRSPGTHPLAPPSQDSAALLARCYSDLVPQTDPGGTNGKEPTCQYRRHKRCGFDPWVGKIPWRRAKQPTPVFLPGDPKDRGAWRATVHRVARSDTTEATKHA